MILMQNRKIDNDIAVSEFDAKDFNPFLKSVLNHIYGNIIRFGYATSNTNINRNPKEDLALNAIDVDYEVLDNE